MSAVLNDPKLAAERRAGAADRLNALSALFEGSAPIIIGLFIIWIIFQFANPNFLRPVNLTNLFLQIAAVGTISIGIVLVLLLGEIDLSVGSVSGFAAAIMAVLSVKAGVPGPVAVLAALGAGLLIGLLQGFWITKLHVPSFVVTLAGLLGWLGAQLFTLGTTGTINLRDNFIVGITLTFFPPIVGWLVGILFVLVFVGGIVWERQRRVAAGLTATSPRNILLYSIIVAIAVLGAVAIFNADRGLPLAAIVFVGLVVIFDLITKRTVYGRHIFAVGGNAEAARRASINVDRIRISVFAFASLLAAAGGILAGSRLLAVNQSSGGSDTLLNSIAAAVIGGTSLFGGRGSAWAALLGALVIGSISNGMDLIALGSPEKFMITGAVLLAAVTLDAIARQRREAAGR
jgi:D-xylose transport system permease protein